MPFDISPSWFDVLKFSGDDGSVSPMANFLAVPTSFLEDKVKPNFDKCHIFRTESGTMVIVRPHFNSQAKKYARLRNHKQYPLKNAIVAIENKGLMAGTYDAFVSAGDKNSEGKGNVDSTFSYTVQDVKRRLEFATDVNLTPTKLLNSLNTEGLIKDVNGWLNPPLRKVLILNSVHGYKEWKEREGRSNFRDIWSETWNAREQLTDRETRLGGN